MTLLRARVLGGTLAVAITLVATACSGGSDGVLPSPAPPSTSTGGTGVSPANLPNPPALDDVEGAVRDVSYGDCPIKSGGVELSGKVKNPTKDSADYVITMNWTNDTFDVLGRGIAVVKDLDGGKSESWKLTAKVAAGATRCTPNVLRGTLKK